MKELDFSETQDLVLEIFYLMAKQNIKAGALTQRAYFVEGASDFFVEKAVEGLGDRKLIKDSILVQAISAKGIERIERERQRAETFLNENFDKYILVQKEVTKKDDLSFGSERTIRAYGLELRKEDDLNLIPASDRIVTLDDNDPKVIKAREALDRVAEEVRANNAYAESEPGDWAQRRAESEASKQLFSAPRISVEAIKGVTLKFLEHLAKKFVDHAIGIAAAGAIAAILALIG